MNRKYPSQAYSNISRPNFNSNRALNLSTEADFRPTVHPDFYYNSNNTRPVIPYSHNFTIPPPNVSQFNCSTHPSYGDSSLPVISPVANPPPLDNCQVNSFHNSTVHNPCQMLQNLPISSSFNSKPPLHLNNDVFHPIPSQLGFNEQIYQPNYAPVAPPSKLSSQQISLEDPLENKLKDFLSNLSSPPHKISVSSRSISVAEFRSALKIGFSLSQALFLSKNTLTKYVNSSEEAWNCHMQYICKMKNQLSDICDMVYDQRNIVIVKKKLLKIKKERERKKRRKQKYLLIKEQKAHDREELHQKIDRWLDSIKEKNIKDKREIEMKKEADIILSEVRRKIQEAIKTIDKLRILEKLRHARNENAIQKGLYSSAEHSAKFIQKVSVLREMIQRQLSDYEAEEKALKVMLDTEQEDQLEQEALWRLKKMQEMQHKKQQDICKILFGEEVKISPGDPLYFFWQYHNAGSASIENLVKIRHNWDIYLVPPDCGGSSIPQQWITPGHPSSCTWETGLLENL